MRAVIASLLVPMLLGAAPGPGLLPNDRVPVLVGTWSCRTMRGAETHKTGTRTGDTIEVVNEVVPAGGEAPYVLYDRFGYDPVIAQWHVVLGTGSPIAIEAIAPTWTSTTWVIIGRQIAGGPTRVTYELIADGDMRRTIEFLSGATWRVSSGERCLRGEKPPPRAL